MKLSGFVIGCLAAMTLGASASASDKALVGTGGPTGVYYAAGQVICELLEASNVPCDAPESRGSVANLQALAAGQINLAMVQSDWQFHAFRGSKRWPHDKMPNLRAIFSVYAEPIQIVVNRQSGINRWRDLRGKRINIGNIGSGQRATTDLLFQQNRWKYDAFAEVHELPSGEQVDAFCDGKFDAFMFTVGVPNAAMRRAVADCNGKMIAPDAATVRKLATAARPYYARATIPAGTYDAAQPKVATFGVMATLVASTDTPDAIVEAVVQSVFGDIDYFRQRHPAFAQATPEQMIKDGLSAPLHDVAAAYYQSQGWN